MENVWKFCVCWLNKYINNNYTLLIVFFSVVDLYNIVFYLDDKIKGFYKVFV